MTYADDKDKICLIVELGLQSYPITLYPSCSIPAIMYLHNFKGSPMEPQNRTVPDCAPCLLIIVLPSAYPTSVAKAISLSPRYNAIGIIVGIFNGNYL